MGTSFTLLCGRSKFVVNFELTGNDSRTIRRTNIILLGDGLNFAYLFERHKTATGHLPRFFAGTCRVRKVPVRQLLLSTPPKSSKSSYKLTLTSLD
jgi:hypothetical protein